ncbi:heterokaryon incompatibility Het-C, partial [Saccharata proteae CBS 121410]
MPSYKLFLLLALTLLVLLPSPAAAFGAGNIASISKIEGHNWRHGDIEDMLKTVACLKGHKWTSMMIKRVYFGNWLRDYSQAVDVGTLKGVQAGTIRILVWVLAFMSFGYATAEFEVTDERLGTYRPEEHIDNPKDYADNVDARQYDPRLRGPVQPEELAIDRNTGMKNYIANESGGWATSAGYIKHSFSRAIHYGRTYTHGHNKGREEDLCEALRCLGQGLHCLEDFGAHTNYTELALRELGFHNVFPHVGTATEINLHGKHVFPLVTGTFGGVDFLHSVLGEATDHFTQADVDTSEVDEMNITLGNAAGGHQGNKSLGGSGSEASGLVDLLAKVPGTSSLCQEAQQLQAMSDAQAAQNSGMGGGARGLDDNYSSSRAAGQTPQFSAPPGSVGGPPGPGIPGMNPNFDPQAIIPKIYPILAFRDKVVRAISSVISKIPGLEALVEKITERVTMFVFSLLAPFIQPIINAASASLKQGSSTVIDASGKHQYEPWTDPHCTDPTHSMLSKDHFSNVLNEPAGQVASAILQYVAPRVIYAWDHPDVPVDEVLNDVVRVFHHPSMRDQHCEIHRNMFAVVERWVHNRPGRGQDLNNLLSSESVRAGHNN